MAVNLIDNEEIHVNQNGSDITLEIQADALKNEDVVVGSIRSKNMIPNLISGYYAVSNGEYISNSGYCCTPYKIEVDNTKQYILTTLSTQSVSGYVMYYDANKTYLGYGSYTTGIAYLLGSSPHWVNTKYVNIRFDTPLSNINNTQLEEGSEATTFSPYQNLDGYDNYSTEEIRIGTWIDGKPLYRKVFTGTTTNDMISSSQIIANFSTTFVPVKTNGYISNYTNNGSFIQIGQYYGTNDYTYYIINPGQIKVRISLDAYAGRNVIFIMEYTKTTD